MIKGYHPSVNERNKAMKYYIKAKNTKTDKTIIMSTPVFTSRKKAQEFADKFTASLLTPVGEMTVIKQNEK